MEVFNVIIGFISKLFQWWYTVMPWEQAIHVHRGNKQKIRGGGMYFKIPFVDVVYIQTCRKRMMEIPMQSMTTKDGQVITVKSNLGYSISNITLLFQTLAHPEVTLGSMAMGFVSEYIRERDSRQLNPLDLENYVKDNIKGEAYGLSGIDIKITTFAIVRVIRIMQDSSGGMYNSMTMDDKR